MLKTATKESIKSIEEDVAKNILKSGAEVGKDAVLDSYEKKQKK